MQNFNTLQTVVAFPFRCADQASNISMQGTSLRAADAGSLAA